MDTKKSICISNSNVVMDIVSAFGNLYPYLMIEFFKGSDIAMAIRAPRIGPDTLIRSLANITGYQTIDMSNDRTVAELIGDLHALLGTRVRISRRSANVWIPVSITAAWSLKSQNSAGKNLSDEINWHGLKPSADQ